MHNHTTPNTHNICHIIADEEENVAQQNRSYKKIIIIICFSNFDGSEWGATNWILLNSIFIRSVRTVSDILILNFKWGYKTRSIYRYNKIAIKSRH